MSVTVPPLVVLVQLDDRPGLVVDHPREAAVCLVCLEQSVVGFVLNMTGFVLKTRPGDLVGAGPNWVTFWSKLGLF